MIFTRRSWKPTRGQSASLGRSYGTWRGENLGWGQFDSLLHTARLASPVRRGDDRIVRHTAAGRNGADRIRRARLTGALRHPVGDRERRRRRDRRRQPRLLADRPPRRPRAVQALGLVGEICTARPTTVGGPVGASWREDRLLRPLRLRALRYTVAWIAGLSRMDWWKFLFWNAAGGIVWATAVALIAYYLGQAAAGGVNATACTRRLPSPAPSCSAGSTVRLAAAAPGRL